jgi:UDPglucose 6-dehydrogenase
VSPSLNIIEVLRKMGFKNVFAYDPLVNPDIDLGVKRVKSLLEILQVVDAVIIATDHDEFRNIDVSLFKENEVKLIIDGRNCLNKEEVASMGIIYKGIGR